MGSIVAAATFPLAVWLILQPSIYVVVAAILAGAFIIYKHKSNIRTAARRVRTRVPFRKRQLVKSLAIIGGGSWGTALAMVLAPRFPDARLWVYEADLAARMRRDPGERRLPCRRAASYSCRNNAAIWQLPWTAPRSS